MLQNGEIKKYLYKILFIHRDIFIGLTLTKEQIIELINYNNNIDFLQLINILKYNNDFLSLLQIIFDQKDLFLKKFLENKDENKNNCISMELLVIPKKEENMNFIYEQIEKIILFEKDSSNFFVKFESNLFEKYSRIFDDSDLDNFIYLNKIFTLLKNDSNFHNNININEIMHKNGISLSNKNLLKNINILNFIEDDIYYKDALYNKESYRSVDILSGIDISSINEEFIKKWKKLK